MHERPSPIGFEFGYGHTTVVCVSGDEPPRTRVAALRVIK